MLVSVQICVAGCVCAVYTCMFACITWDYMLSLANGWNWGCAAAQGFLNRNHSYLVQYMAGI